MRSALLAVAAARQPLESYVSAPKVPLPPKTLAPLLSSAPPADCDESCFVAFAEDAVHRAAARAWSFVDENADGQLDLEELTTVVGQKRRFQAELWPFLSLLAKHFSSIDLSR